MPHQFHVGDMVYICKPARLTSDMISWKSYHDEFDKKFVMVKGVTIKGNIRICGSNLLFDRMWAVKIDDDYFETEDLSCLM